MKDYDHNERKDFVKSCGLDNMFVSFVKLKVKMTNIDTDIQSEMVQKIEKFSKNNRPFLRALIMIACKAIIEENKNNRIK